MGENEERQMGRCQRQLPNEIWHSPVLHTGWENNFFLLLKFTFLYHKTLHSENLESLEAKVTFFVNTDRCLIIIFSLDEGERGILIVEYL